MNLVDALGAGLGSVFAARRTQPDEIQSPGGSFLGMFRKVVAGEHVNRESALSLSVVWACVRLISEHIAMMPHRVHERDGDKRRIAADHPVDRILHRMANPETNAFDFHQSLLACALLEGNGIAEIERLRDGTPEAVWQIEWDRVNPARDQRGRLIYEISNGGAANSVLLPEDVLHVRGFTLDGITGLSVIEFAKQAIGLGLAAEKFGASFFGNSAIPSGVIEWDTAEGDSGIDFTAEAARNQKRTWRKNHSSAAGRSGGIEILEPGQRFKAVSIKPEEAQFLESRKFGVTEICRWYGVPPHKVADLERSTNSNIEAQNIEYVTDCLMRWAVRLEQEINAKLLRGNYYSKVNFNALLRGDTAARKEYYSAMWDRGILSINEIRKREDENPVEGGDMRFVPLNMASLEQANKNGNTVQQSGESDD